MPDSSQRTRPHLKQGSRLAVVSPASAAKSELVHAGCDRLRAFGYGPVLFPHALASGPLYYAGTARQRADDLHAAFAAPAQPLSSFREAGGSASPTSALDTIDGILCTRGGWGSAELLPLLDAAVIRANPKPFIGYSDHTSLHAWLWNECRLETFYAPMVAADWSKSDGVDEPSWRAALEFAPSTYTFGEEAGLRILRSGEASGRLLGGCLSILEAALGTPYALRLDEPTILFAEDIGTKPYQWDRMLQHLRFAGLLDHVTGIVLGDMSANVTEAEMPLLEASCLHALAAFQGPIAIGLQSGHVSRRNHSLRLGAPADLICDVHPTLDIH